MTTENLTQVKEAFSYLMQICNNDKSEVKEVFEKLTDFTDFEGLKKSLKNNDITISEFLSGEYYHENNLYYSYDYYVMTREGDIVLTDDANFCQYYEEYTSEDVSKVYEGRNEHWYCETAINNLNLHYYDDAYYDYDALDRHDLTELDGEIYHTSDLYYYDDEYHTEEQTKEQFIREYHNNNGIFKKLEFFKKSQFYIGFEIEKEDEDIKESINIDDFDKATGYLWRKERDGSLDDTTGFELVSPTFELDVCEIEKHIRANKILISHINANKSTSCGGHINVSEEGKTGEELFNSVKGFTPLFHALYSGRLNVNYSKGKSNERLLNDNEKYQSIKIHDNRIEYRIVSAVSSVSNLIWRAKLIDFIMNNQTSDIKQAFFLINTTLKPLLMQVYNTNEKFEALMNKVIKYTLNYEAIELAKFNGQMFIEFNEEVTNS